MNSVNYQRSFSNQSDSSSVYTNDIPERQSSKPSETEEGMQSISSMHQPMIRAVKTQPASQDNSFNLSDTSFPELPPQETSYEVQRNMQAVQPVNMPSPQGTIIPSPDHSEIASVYSHANSEGNSIRMSPPLLGDLPSPEYSNSQSNLSDSYVEQYLPDQINTVSLNDSDSAQPKFPSSRSVPTLNSRASTSTLANRHSRRSSAKLASRRTSSYFDFGMFGNPDPASGGGSALLPRLKTIDLYRKNAKKSNDPDLEFQLAQFIMQTALIAKKSLGESEHRRTISSVSTNSTGIVKDQDQEQELPGSSGSNTSIDAESMIDNKAVRSMLRESASSLKRLAERGHADSQYLLGDLYFSEALGKPDLEKGAKYFIMAAKHGHAEASYRAALCLQEGWGTPRDAARAVQFYKTAAFKNQPGALYQLGMVYFYSGLGIADNTNNRLSGVKWLARGAKLADKTYNRAPHELAKIYEVGYKDLVFPDAGYAARLYAQSADLGYIPSAARLGKAYEFGELSCPQDSALSIHYYTLAALGNDPKSQLSMCAWYMVGAGPTFPVNQDEAYEWALRAALNGLPKAQYTVGFFLEQGIGVHQNVVDAAKWYRKAAANGYKKAEDKLISLGVKDSKTGKNKCLIM